MCNKTYKLQKYRQGIGVKQGAQKNINFLKSSFFWYKQEYTMP